MLHRVTSFRIAAPECCAEMIACLGDQRLVLSPSFVAGGEVLYIAGYDGWVRFCPFCGMKVEGYPDGPEDE